MQDLWANVVYQAHKQVVSILENKNTAVSASNGTAILNLRPFVVRASERIGIGVNLARSLPAGAGRVTILHSDQLGTAQRAARWLNAVADWFWVLAIAAWAAALWIRPRDRRQELGAIAVGLVLVGLALLIERAIAGHYIVDSLIKDETVRPAGHSAWEILTARLADSAWTAIGVGAVGLFGLWFQGGRRSRSLRALLAPVLRSLDLAYALLAALLLLLFWWGPTVETRELRGLALIVPASIIGFELIRRSTVRIPKRLTVRPGRLCVRRLRGRRRRRPMSSNDWSALRACTSRERSATRSSWPRSTPCSAPKTSFSPPVRRTCRRP